VLVELGEVELVLLALQRFHDLADLFALGFGLLAIGEGGEQGDAENGLIGVLHGVFLLSVWWDYRSFEWLPVVEFRGRAATTGHESRLECRQYPTLWMMHENHVPRGHR